MSHIYSFSFHNTLFVHANKQRDLLHVEYECTLVCKRGLSPFDQSLPKVR